MPTNNIDVTYPIRMLREVIGAKDGRRKNKGLPFDSSGRLVGAGIRRDLQSSGQVELFKNVVDVTLDGIRRNMEFASNLFVAQSFRYKIDDFSFTDRHLNHTVGNQLAVR